MRSQGRGTEQRSGTGCSRILEQGAEVLGTVDVCDKVLEGGVVLVVLDEAVQGSGSFLVVVLVVGEHGPLGPGRVDGRGPDQPGQNSAIDDHLVEQRTEIRHFWFS